MPWPILTKIHSLQTRKLKLSIFVRDNSIAFRTIEIRRVIHGEVIVDCARSVDDNHHFERLYLKTALIDVMALFAWAGSYLLWCFIVMYLASRFWAVHVRSWFHSGRHLSIVLCLVANTRTHMHNGWEGKREKLRGFLSLQERAREKCGCMYHTTRYVCAYTNTSNCTCQQWTCEDVY